MIILKGLFNRQNTIVLQSTRGLHIHNMFKIDVSTSIPRIIMEQTHQRWRQTMSNLYKKGFNQIRKDIKIYML